MITALRHRPLVRNTLLNLSGQVAPLIVSVLTIPKVFRGLGEERFGLLALILIVAGYFSIFDLGLGRATTRLVAETIGKGDYRRLPSIAWTASITQCVFGVLAGLILALLTPVLIERFLNISPLRLEEARSGFYVVALSVPFVLLANSLRALLEAAQRFDLVNANAVPFSILNALTPLVGVYLGWTLPIIVAALVVLRIMNTAAYAWLCLGLFPSLRGNPRFEPNVLLPLAAFGGWVTISSVVGPIFLYIDRFFIGALVSVSAVSYYTVPSDVITRLWILPVSLSVTLFPAFSGMGSTRLENVAPTFARAQKTVFMLVGPTVLVLLLLADRVLRIWLGDTFAARSVTVFQTFAFGAIVGCLAPVSGMLIQSFGRPDIVAKVYVFLHLPLTVALGWYLIGTLGIEGAALTTALRTILDSVILFWVAAGLLTPTGDRHTDWLPRAGGAAIALVSLLGVALATAGKIAINPVSVLAAGGLLSMWAWYRVLNGLTRHTHAAAQTTNAPQAREA